MSANVFWKVERERAEKLELELSAAKDEIAALKEDIAMRVGQARNALIERDRYKSEAERKRLIAREFESVLGFTAEEARKEGAIEEAIRRIQALKSR